MYGYTKLQRLTYFHKNKALNLMFIGQDNQDDGIQFEMMRVKK